MERFRLLKQFNGLENARAIIRRKRLMPSDERAFFREGPIDRFARALCKHRATSLRELVESFEFFALARKHSRARIVVDLCGGHGLVAVLFAMFERVVERALVVDRVRQPSFDRILAAAREAAPWTEGRIEFVSAQLRDAPELVPAEAGLLAVHACGKKTDVALDLAVHNWVPIAVMPCCHPVAGSPAPAALKKELGAVAVDVDRTYRLEAAGFHVRWSSISGDITRKNRVILARPRTAPK